MLAMRMMYMRTLVYTYREYVYLGFMRIFYLRVYIHILEMRVQIVKKGPVTENRYFGNEEMKKRQKRLWLSPFLNWNRAYYKKLKLTGYGLICMGHKF